MYVVCGGVEETFVASLLYVATLDLEEGSAYEGGGSEYALWYSAVYGVLGYVF